MKRRQYLAVTGAGLGTLVAGCGFAHYGGALRGETTLFGPDSRRHFVSTDDGFVIARRDRRLVQNDGVGFDQVTVTAVTGYANEGYQQWSTAIESASDGIALGDSLVVLQENHLTALDPTATENNGDDSIDPPIEWETTINGLRWPIAAIDEIVYVSTNETIAQVVDAEVTWTRTVPGAPQSLYAHDGGVIATTPEGLVALDADGDENWTVETDRQPFLDHQGNDVAFRNDEAVSLLDRDDATEHWRKSIPAGGYAPRMSDDAVVVPTGEGIIQFDRTTGNQEWQIQTGHRPHPVLVLGPTATYSATADGTVLAIDSGEITWEHVGDWTDDPLDSWIDNDQVAVLYESGTVRRFQRTDQDVPIFS